MAERIGFGNRLGAAIIDMIISMFGGMACGALLGGILGGAVGAGVGATTGDPSGGLAGGALGAMFGGGIGLIAFAVLYGLIEAVTGASPGKMILGLQIGNDDGTIAAISTLFTRYAAKNISMLLSFLSLITGIQMIYSVGTIAGFIIFIGFFMVLGAKRQAIHDMVANTAVFRKHELTDSNFPVAEQAESGFEQ